MTGMGLLDGDKISFGNAEDARFDSNRGWFVGGFQETAVGLRHSNDVEIKWSRHVQGDARSKISMLESATSVAILVSGSFIFNFPGEDPSRIKLSKQGDYVIYAPGVAHTWLALGESTLITIRWPGRSEYRESVPTP